jgi:hypothetical protein
MIGRPDAHLSTVPAIRTTYHTVQTPDRPKHHPSGRRGFPFGHSSVSRSFCSSLHPSGRFSRPSERLSVIELQIFFPKANMGRLLQLSRLLSKSKYGKIVATVQTTWIPVRMCYSLRQVCNSNSTVQRSVCHGPDAWSLSKEITCSERAIVRTIVPHRPNAALKQERFSAKISEFWSHSCPSGRPMSTVRTAPVFIKAVTHLNPQPINRGLWSLRPARIRYWIPLELRELFVRLLSWFVLSRAIIVCAVAALKLKSILGVGPKVKDSIEDPFR